MFEKLFMTPQDPLLKLINEFNTDKRTDKIDLGVGVYRNQKGVTPVMNAVKSAESQLIKNQDSKSYLGLAGDMEYLDLMGHLVFGGIRPKKSRFAYLQTPGGSAALRLAGDIIKRSTPYTRVWVGLPCWTNHIPIFSAAGLKIETFNYYDRENGHVDFESVMMATTNAQAGDVILLQACGHNPTGVDLNLEQWKCIAQQCVERGLIPFFDLAYHGLADGLETDLSGLNIVMDIVPEALAAVSCSKNFGLYRERTGALYVMTPSSKKAEVSLTNLFELARTSYSMPPDHGAAIVRLILRDAELRQDWEAELAEMRNQIQLTRMQLAQGTGKHNLSFIKDGKGMFTMLPITAEQIARLRKDHAIYMAANGRINLAGLPQSKFDKFISALDAVLA